MPRHIRSASRNWCCAGSSCCASGKSIGSTSTAQTRSFRIAGRQYLGAIPKAERDDLVSAFYKRLTSRNRATQLKAAKAWAVWEGSTSYLLINEANVTNWEADDFAIAVARIECHYFVNRGFFEREDQLLRNVRRIRKIPGVIVQGRYDVVCPCAVPGTCTRPGPKRISASLPDAGHSALEPGNTHELVSATDRFAK